MSNHKWQREATKPKKSLKKRMAQWSGLIVICLFSIGVWGAALEDPEVREERRAKLAEQAKRDAIAKFERDKAEAAEQRIALCDRSTVAAYSKSQQEVTARLRSPSSAKFPWITEIASEHVGDCKFQIFAHVDAQNGFGAMLRIYYQAKLQYQPETKRWRALSVKISN
ncbi:MAG: hypothetical protein AAF870_04570 [Pseudomonadota bacterium]